MVVRTERGGDGWWQKGVDSCVRAAWADGWRVNRTLAPRRRLREAWPRALAIERTPSPICPTTHPPLLCFSVSFSHSRSLLPPYLSTLCTLPLASTQLPLPPSLRLPLFFPHTTTPLTLIHDVPNYGYVYMYIYTYILVYICARIYVHICMYI